jgi:hypothetical protein
MMSGAVQNESNHHDAKLLYTGVDGDGKTYSARDDHDDDDDTLLIDSSLSLSGSNKKRRWRENEDCNSSSSNKDATVATVTCAYSFAEGEGEEGNHAIKFDQRAARAEHSASYTTHPAMNTFSDCNKELFDALQQDHSSAPTAGGVGARGISNRDLDAMYERYGTSIGDGYAAQGRSDGLAWSVLQNCNVNTQ